MTDDPLRHPAKSCGMVLGYQDLPPISNIRREIGENGVKFVIPAGVGRSERMSSYRQTLAPATFLTALLLAGGTIAVRFWFPLRLDLAEVILAVSAFAVFAGALFALIWRVLAMRDVDARASLRKSAVAIAADSRRLLIETSGADQNESIQISSDEIDRIEVASRWRDAASFPELRIRMRRGESRTIVAGLDALELECVASTLRWALQERHSSHP